jgi:hypothetical protein
MELPAARRPWFETVVASHKVRATYLSLVGHVAVFLVLAWLATPPRTSPQRVVQIALTAPEAVDRPAVEILPTPEPAAEGDAREDAAGAAAAVAVAVQESLVAPAEPDLTEAFQDVSFEPRQTMPAAIAVIETAATPSIAAPVHARAAAPVTNVSAAGRATFAGRFGEARSRGVMDRGGSAASEAAVERGLEWLARHQAADGSWRFDLSACRCDGACSHPGTVTSTTAATGIALLPFLGAGHTHTDGAYRETVTRGLYYLMSRMRPSPRGGELSEGTMYGHGVATLALAEAFGMTSDPMLAPYVRDAVRFIETSQDMHGGGWRYLPGQAGDTTVTAWQLAALKSAAIAGAAVPSPTIDAACRFFDRVQVRQGEAYGYLSPQDRSCTSAIGLLCRIYTAWPDERTLDRGLARLAKPGPPPEAAYQNFYLAQALLLREHPAWRRWNVANREQLIGRQGRLGHETGSWSFADADTAPGGRLGHTALAVLTLEVYYRLLPIYSEQAAQTGW